MMTLKRITEFADKCFDKLMPLYFDAFCPEERRQVEQLKYLIKNRTSMYFNAVECDGELAGLFVYWDFEDFFYLEHLAVFSEMRNKKIGQQVLDFAKENLKGIRLLEVEPTTDEITTRRVNYYQRNGYKILDKGYIQPSYDGERDAVPLWIMGNEEYTDAERLSRHVDLIKEKVYFENQKIRG